MTKKGETIKEYTIDLENRNQLTVLQQLTDEFEKKYRASNNPIEWVKLRNQYIFDFIAKSPSLDDNQSPIFNFGDQNIKDLKVYCLRHNMFEVLCAGPLNSNTVNVGSIIRTQNGILDAFNKAYKDGLIDDLGLRKVTMLFGKKIESNKEDSLVEQDTTMSLFEAKLINTIIMVNRIDKASEMAKSIFYEYVFPEDWVEFSKQFSIVCNNSKKEIAEIFRKAQVRVVPEGLSTSLKYIEDEIEANLTYVPSVRITNNPNRGMYVNRNMKADSCGEVGAMLDIAEAEAHLGDLVQFDKMVANNYCATIKGCKITNEMLKQFEDYYSGLAKTPIIMEDDKDDLVTPDQAAQTGYTIEDKEDPIM